ncbi:aquaporin family protein [Ramlibacter sp.]|uniref:aquaporin family protein n=1 Tax=Ramlibacter sp. TaxID=1917967 RepID=UPI0025E30CB9|nr:aquaporin family protein [Ramlibacter sp.]
MVGFGILSERLAAGNTAIALLASALATAGALYALIEWLGRCRARISIPRPASATQCAAAVIGVGVANAMFEAPLFSLSAHVRAGPAQWLGEFVATFGLVGAVWVCSRVRPASVAGVVAAYIGGGFWFTPTGFANPAVTFARAFTDSFSGIRLVDVPGFLAAQAVGTAAAVLLFRWMLPGEACAAATCAAAPPAAPARS